MASVVNTNVMSINAQRNLMKTQNDMASTIQRLSSGLRINSAKDDAAGLAVSEGMTSQIRGLEMAKRNANDGISMAQTAEGALGQISNNVQRIRELAVQSSNGALSDADRAHLQKEADELSFENKRIVDTTEFNGQNLLNKAVGATTDFNIQVGANGTDQIALKVDGVNDLNSIGAAAGDVDISTEAAAKALLSNGAATGAGTTLDDDLFNLNAARATLGASQNRFESVIDNIGNYSENLQAARSRIQDTDFAAETANLTRNQILSQAGTAMVSQANSMPQSVLSLL
ncbi:MAG: flagellin N-terminal helical domain-containing protein [bacterium]